MVTGSKKRPFSASPRPTFQCTLNNMTRFFVDETVVQIPSLGDEKIR
jgi:hypothetical protein